MPANARWTRWWAVAGVALLVAACGSRVPEVKPVTPPATTTPAATTTAVAPTTTAVGATTPVLPSTAVATTTGASTTAATTPTTPTTAATAPADPAAATAQITANWQKFFDHGTPIDDRVALLQNGAALRPALEQRATDPLQQQATATVKNVTYTSPAEATVTYDVALNGQVALPGAQGMAVLENDVWKVSQASFCSLISLGATAPIPGC